MKMFAWLFTRRTSPEVRAKRESEHHLMATESVMQQYEQRVANIERERRIRLRKPDDDERVSD